MSSNENEELPPQPIQDEGELDLDLRFKASLVGHTWRQQGPFLVCKSCPLEHGAHVGMDIELVGIDDKGMPKFVKRS